MSSRAAAHVQQLPTRVVIAAAREANRQFLEAFPSSYSTTATDAIYDSATDPNHDPNQGVASAIRIDTAVYMPDEEIAVEVNARYAEIRQNLVLERRRFVALGHANADWKAFKTVRASLGQMRVIEQAPYKVFFRLDYREGRATGQANTVRIYVEARRTGGAADERSDPIPVRFINLYGGLAKDFYFAD